MGKRIRIEISTQDGENEEVIEVEIADELIKKFELYKESCDKLWNTTLLSEKRTASLQMKYEAGNNSFLVHSEVPNDQDIDGFLLRLRPFILNDEPTNFNYITNRLIILLRGSVFEPKIKYIKRVFNVEYLGGMKFIIDGQEITSNETLDKWLNGYSYHLDEDKRDQISKLYAAFPEPAVKAIFIDMLFAKTAQIFEIGNLIIFLLGLETKLRFNI